MAVSTELQGILDALSEPRLLIRPDYSVAYANRAFRQRFGIQFCEGRSCHELVFHELHPCAACGRTCPLDRAAVSGRPERVIERDFVPGGERFVELESVPVTSADGAAVYFMEQVLVRDDPQSVYEREGIVMKSAAVRRVLAEIGRVAALDIPVLFCGPSGCGKARFARLLHENSRRAVHAFIKIDCASLTEERFEHELLGSISDAGAARSGGLASGAGGTLYFDEVADLSPGMQRRLLMLLETGFVREAGFERSVAVGWRILCGTSASEPEALVRQGALRADLWLRLCVASIRIPPLSERTEDIEELAHSILKRSASETGGARVLSERALAALRSRAWPGNIRELESVLARASLTASRGEILPEDLSEPLGDRPEPAAALRRTSLDGSALEQMLAGGKEKQTRRALAQALGISERTLYRRLKAGKAES